MQLVGSLRTVLKSVLRAYILACQDGSIRQLVPRQPFVPPLDTLGTVPVLFLLLSPPGSISLETLAR